MTVKNKIDKVAIVGAGSWGTALSMVLSLKAKTVMLWGRREEHVRQLVVHRENRRHLPGIVLSDNIIPTNDLAAAVQNAEIICAVVPSHSFRTVFELMTPLLGDRAIIVSAIKGVENSTLMTMTQVMDQILEWEQRQDVIQTAVLSGPSFAKEVAQGIPTAVTIGCKDITIAQYLQNVFATDTFRVYVSTDVIGLEISAALKNIIAIAAGICDGLGYGMNTKAALITRGLTEIVRLGVRLGAEKETFFGLSGLGDLVLTCTGDLSRNRSVGMELGRGFKLVDILSEMMTVAEGVKTTKSIYDLTRLLDIEMPILEQVYTILYEEKECSLAVKDLLARELKME